MRKKVLILLISIILILPSNAKALSCIKDNFKADITIDKDKINVGEMAIININSNNTYSINYELSEKDIISIDQDGIIKGIKPGNVKVNITMSYDKDGIKDSCITSIPILVASSDASLKSLTLEELDLSPIFNSQQYNYELRLPYTFDEINISAEPNNENAKVVGTGNHDLHIGLNEYKIKVTSDDGTSLTYTLSIFREEANTATTLKNLEVKGFKLSPKFDPNVHNYTVDVDKEVDMITINATPTYSFAKVSGDGKFTLATGKNIFYISVTSENGEKGKYILEVNKENGNSKLSDIKIDGYNLEETFNSDTYTYNLTIPNEVDNLKITPSLVDTDAQVEIIGNDNIKVGENEVIIKVTNSDNSSTTYKILVTRLSNVEQKIVKENHILLIVLFIMFIISITITVILIIVFLKRNKKKKYRLKRSIKIRK